MTKCDKDIYGTLKYVTIKLHCRLQNQSVNYKWHFLKHRTELFS